MNFQHTTVNKGKVVYWINHQRFENSTGKRDGRQRAEEYCYNNSLNPKNIQKFDSRTECNRFEYLLSLQEQGVISNLDHHFEIRVQDEFVNSNGDNVPAITYEADFVYDQDGRRVVEDVKGSEYFIDERFITLKQVFDKIMLPKNQYIKVVMFRNGQWVEWHIGEPKKQSKLIKKQRAEIKKLRDEAHTREIQDNKIAREKNRLRELRLKVTLGTILRSDEKKRLRELEEKYGNE